MKSSFKSVKTIESIYTGGKVVITDDAKYLITTLNEDIIVTELDTGKQVYELEGVCIDDTVNIQHLTYFYMPNRIPRLSPQWQ